MSTRRAPGTDRDGPGRRAPGADRDGSGRCAPGAGDWRLASPALGSWLVVVLGLTAPLGVTTAVVVACAALAAGGGILLVHRTPLIGRTPVLQRTPVTGGARVAGGVRVAGGARVTEGARVVQGARGQRRLAATLLATGGVAAAAGLGVVVRADAAAHAPIRDATGTPVVELTVTGDPLPVGATESQVRVAARLDAVAGVSQRRVPVELVGNVRDFGDVLPGARYRLRVQVKAPRGGAGERLTAARLWAVGRAELLAPPPVWQRAAGHIRVRMREAAARGLGPPAAGLLPGLVLGDVSGLDPGVRQQFRDASLSHLMAVSGANFSLIVGAVVLCVRAAGGSPRLTVLAGVLATIGFVILVRPSDSVLRAAIMGCVGLAAVLMSRRSQALPALGAAVVVVLLLWPQLALAPGFLLSVAATLGLVLWAAPIRFALRRRGVPDPLAVLGAMTLAAQILTMPLLILITDRMSLTAIPANLLAAPVVAIIGIGGTLAALLAALGPPGGAGLVAAELLVRAVGPEVWWLLKCAEIFGGQSWSSVSVPGRPVVAAGLVVVVLVRAIRARRARSVGRVSRDRRARVAWSLRRRIARSSP